MKIIPLSEGTFTIDKTKVFVPFEQETDELLHRPIGSLLVEVQPFVVVTDKDILLLDTGLGFSRNGEPQIYQNLKQQGIDPKDVTKVLLTHLHKDHAGGVSFKDKLGHYTIGFPNATYYVQRQELDYAFDVGFPSYIIDEIAILTNNKQVVLLDGNGTIDDYIHYEISGGHCPYHQVFKIVDQERIIFFGGDVATQLSQMKSRFAAKYDYDGKRSRDLRFEWWEQGQRENWTFLFYHDIKEPVYPAP